MSKCVDTCKKPTPFQAHCSVCHRTFGGVTGFDDHRKSGKPRRKMGECIDPGTILNEKREPVYVEKDGVWRQPMDHQKAEMFRARVSRAKVTE